MSIRTNKWLDGKQGYMWPIEKHLGWAVATAGPVDLDLEERTVMYNDGPTRLLPYGFKMVLKEIDNSDMAYLYHHNEGVIKIPAQLLEPVGV
jgi:hypothetical protein